MSVKKIRKISSVTMLAIMAISVIVLGLFFFGGTVDPNAAQKEPVYTGLLLNWTIILFGILVVATLGFLIFGFANSFANNRKKALTSLAAVVLLVVIMFVAYTIGSDTPLKLLSADSQAFNTPGWLKTADMWLYTVYVLMGLCIIAVIWGSVRKAIQK